MNVVFVNDSCSVNGGAASVAIAEAIGLASRGHKVSFFGVTGPVDARLAAAGVTVHCLGGKSFLDDPDRKSAALRGLWDPVSYRELRKFLAEFDPKNTIVHLHGWMKALSPSVFSAIRVSGFKLVITLHDYFLACPNGGFLVYPTSEICRRVALSRECVFCNCDPRSKMQKAWRVVRGMIQNWVIKAAEHTDGFVAVSEFSLGKLRYYLPEQKLARVIRNPLDITKPTTSGGNASGPLIFVGRLSPEKGPHVFAEAIRRTGRDATIIGDGPMGTMLRRDYPEIEFTGWLGRSEVLDRMRTSSGLVFPSVWYETNGLVVAEAMALGLPVFASCGTAADEFIESDRNGFYFQMGNAEDLSRMIVEKESEKWTVARRAFDSYWRFPWTVEQHAQELVEFYEVIQKNNLR